MGSGTNDANGGSSSAARPFEAGIRGKTKGTHVVKAVKLLRLYKDVAREVLPERLHWYLGKQILESSWYDEDEHRELMAALAAVLEQVSLVPKGMNTWTFMGREAAAQDVTGVYRTMLKRGNPAATLGAQAQLWHVRWNSGHMGVTQHAPGHATCVLTDYEILSEGWCRMIRGYTERLLELAGAKDVEIEELECLGRGDRRCRRQIRWTEP